MVLIKSCGCCGDLKVNVAWALFIDWFLAVLIMTMFACASANYGHSVSPGARYLMMWQIFVAITSIRVTCTLMAMGTAGKIQTAPSYWLPYFIYKIIETLILLGIIIASFKELKPDFFTIFIKTDCIELIEFFYPILTTDIISAITNRNIKLESNKQSVLIKYRSVFLVWLVVSFFVLFFVHNYYKSLYERISKRLTLPAPQPLNLEENVSLEEKTNSTNVQNLAIISQLSTRNEVANNSQVKLPADNSIELRELVTKSDSVTHSEATKSEPVKPQGEDSSNLQDNAVLPDNPLSSNSETKNSQPEDPNQL